MVLAVMLSYVHKSFHLHRRPFIEHSLFDTLIGLVKQAK